MSRSFLKETGPVLLPVPASLLEGVELPHASSEAEAMRVPTQVAVNEMERMFATS